jgi:hypothetical protein
MTGDISDSPYIDSALHPEEKPLELIAYYDLNYNYFNTTEQKDVPANKSLYSITSASIHPVLLC